MITNFLMELTQLDLISHLSTAIYYNLSPYQSVKVWCYLSKLICTCNNNLSSSNTSLSWYLRWVWVYIRTRKTDTNRFPPRSQGKLELGLHQLCFLSALLFRFLIVENRFVCNIARIVSFSFKFNKCAQVFLHFWKKKSGLTGNMIYI